MKITADTNVLVRGVVRDDESQARTVDKTLNEATLIRDFPLGFFKASK